MKNQNKIIINLKNVLQRFDRWLKGGFSVWIMSWLQTCSEQNQILMWSREQTSLNKELCRFLMHHLICLYFDPHNKVLNCVIGCSWTSPEADQCPEQSHQSRTRPNTAFKGWLGEWSQRPSCKLPNVQRTRYWKPYSRCWSRERS